MVWYNPSTWFSAVAPTTSSTTLTTSNSAIAAPSKTPVNQQTVQQAVNQVTGVTPKPIAPTTGTSTGGYTISYSGGGSNAPTTSSSTGSTTTTTTQTKPTITSNNVGASVMTGQTNKAPTKPTVLQDISRLDRERRQNAIDQLRGFSLTTPSGIYGAIPTKDEQPIPIPKGYKINVGEEKTSLGLDKTWSYDYGTSDFQKAMTEKFTEPTSYSGNSVITTSQKQVAPMSYESANPELLYPQSPQPESKPTVMEDIFGNTMGKIPYVIMPISSMIGAVSSEKGNKAIADITGISKLPSMPDWKYVDVVQRQMNPLKNYMDKDLIDFSQGFNERMYGLTAGTYEYARTHPVETAVTVATSFGTGLAFKGVEAGVTIGLAKLAPKAPELAAGLGFGFRWIPVGLYAGSKAIELSNAKTGYEQGQIVGKSLLFEVAPAMGGYSFGEKTIFKGWSQKAYKEQTLTVRRTWDVQTAKHPELQGQKLTDFLTKKSNWAEQYAIETKIVGGIKGVGKAMTEVSVGDIAGAKSIRGAKEQLINFGSAAKEGYVENLPTTFKYEDFGKTYQIGTKPESIELGTERMWYTFEPKDIPTIRAFNEAKADLAVKGFGAKTGKISTDKNFGDVIKNIFKDEATRNAFVDTLGVKGSRYIIARTTGLGRIKIQGSGAYERLMDTPKGTFGLSRLAKKGGAGDVDEGSWFSSFLIKKQAKVIADVNAYDYLNVKYDSSKISMGATKKVESHSLNFDNNPFTRNGQWVKENNGKWMFYQSLQEGVARKGIDSIKLEKMYRQEKDNSDTFDILRYQAKNKLTKKFSVEDVNALQKKYESINSFKEIKPTKITTTKELTTSFAKNNIGKTIGSVSGGSSVSISKGMGSFGSTSKSTSESLSKSISKPDISISKSISLSKPSISKSTSKSISRPEISKFTSFSKSNPSTSISVPSFSTSTSTSTSSSDSLSRPEPPKIPGLIGGGGIGFGRGRNGSPRTKRVNKYTPTLIGLDMKPIKGSAPKANKMFTGIEIRPMIISNTKSKRRK